jgi:predicted patatin/cPLA2 family phospholipase
MNNTGLVLEGGGLRGIFSAGILDFFLEKNIEFPYIIGTSMGALNAASYVSKQKGRSFRIPHTYIKDSRYLSLKNLIKEGSYFGMDFIFNKVVNELDPFDFETFENSSQRFISVTANCLNGKAEYFDKIEDRDKMMDILKATSSLPFISKMIEIDNKKYLDGGLIDSIPIEKALDDKIEKPVIILTRPKYYRKKSGGTTLSKIYYKNYPKVTEMIENKAKTYNEQIEFIEKLEEENKVFVIRPSNPIEMGRTEKSPEKLKKAYEYGYETIKNIENELMKWLNS